jgi:hypothetical protein
MMRKSEAERLIGSKRMRLAEHATPTGEINFQQNFGWRMYKENIA